MKKEKQESPEKVAKKKAKDAIQSRLTKVLKTITTELGQEAINIEKEAKKLAKKLTKDFQSGLEAGKEAVVAATIETSAKKSKAVKEKPAAKPAATDDKKPVAKAAPKALVPKVKSTKK